MAEGSYPAAERALQPKASFVECAGCPDMVVVPAGTFPMGSPEGEAGRKATESPRHAVTIPHAFAVSRFEVTFDQWDACVATGGCEYQPPDEGWGRGRRPVINVSWEDAQQYAAWLARRTGKPYRLLSEAEWEYAARAGAEGAYAWGEDVGESRANCRNCGSKWDNNQTAPVGSFAASGFGLNDMLGNVWEWVEDCWHDGYNGAPADGSAWTTACTDEAHHVVRGGGWNDEPADLRAAARYDGPTRIRNWVNGMRVGRSLNQ